MPTLVNAHLFYNSHSNRYIMMSHCGLGRHFLMSSNAGQFVMRVLAICIHFWRTVCSNGEGNGTPLQYSCLENPMDKRAWWAAVHGVAKSQTRLSHFTLTFHFHALEKEMATHSSVLAWRIPGMAEPGELLSMGSHRVGHN